MFVQINGNQVISLETMRLFQEGKILFNDTQHILFTLYGVGHRVKDHSAREETHFHHNMGYSFQLTAIQQAIFYMYLSTESTAHTIAFIIPVVEHWLEQQIPQRVHHEGLIWDPLLHDWMI